MASFLILKVANINMSLRSLPPAHPDLPAPRPEDTAWITSFLRSRNAQATRSAVSTLTSYRLATELLARWATAHDRPVLPELTRADLETYVVWMRDTARKRNGQPFAPAYVNNQYRALHAFYTWLTEVEEEIDEHPMRKMTTPRIPEKLTSLLSDEDMILMLKPLEKAKDFESRRDVAILRMFFSSGVRLEELTTMELGHLDLNGLRISVIGKNTKQREVRFDQRTAVAIDRYLRVRPKHKYALENTRLWLPSLHRRTPLTPSGVRQIVQRRAKAVGITIHPHVFRHTFSSTWLSNGGTETDLMTQNGWTSAAMCRRYGAIARTARAQAAYDRIMGAGLAK